MDIKLNNDLLKSTSDDEKKQDKPKKRNSKEELIDKIIQVAEQNQITIRHSDTKLKRMTKQQLNELLAETIEKVMRDEMARQVGAKPGAADSPPDGPRYLRERYGAVLQYIFTPVWV